MALHHRLSHYDDESAYAAQTNYGSGHPHKPVLTGDGPVLMTEPRDRDGAFAPALIPTHARRFTGFDDKIIATYARGTSVRETPG